NKGDEKKGEKSRKTASGVWWGCLPGLEAHGSSLELVECGCQSHRIALASGEKSGSLVVTLSPIFGLMPSELRLFPEVLEPSSHVARPCKRAVSCRSFPPPHRLAMPSRTRKPFRGCGRPTNAAGLRPPSSTEPLS